MTFEQFTQAHAGRDFESFTAFTAEVTRAGLSDTDKHAAYRAWRLGWGRALAGGGELKATQPGKIKTWSAPQ
ncbi:hypothetical protein [Oceanicaulis sp.]|uniref:hypothetical protein n=1 Tax=Oceanicaulis sp. TaxID=1924941 RepID=UPI003D2B2053